MPKTNETPRGSLAEINQMEISTTHMNRGYDLEFLGKQLQISAGEVVAAISAFYLICIASFNAGYFSSVKGRFVELFSFSDLIGTNIPILQYFFSVYFIYSAIGLAHTFIFANFLNRYKEGLDDFLENSFYWVGRSANFFWIGFFLLFLSLIILLERKSFNIAILPYVFFQGLGAYALWIGWQRHATSGRTFVTTCIIGVICFSYTSGRLWALDDIRDPSHLQSITLKSGQCIDRILLRTNSTGYLLYSTDLKQFEFRSKDDVLTIFAAKGCV